jgi:hypothetical protein
VCFFSHCNILSIETIYTFDTSQTNLDVALTARYTLISKGMDSFFDAEIEENKIVVHQSTCSACTKTWMVKVTKQADIQPNMTSAVNGRSDYNSINTVDRLMGSLRFKMQCQMLEEMPITRPPSEGKETMIFQYRMEEGSVHRCRFERES